MQMQSYYEYRCPRCGYINAIAKESIVSMYKEQVECCQHCKQSLDIVIANGLNDQVNLIVSEHIEGNK